MNTETSSHLTNDHMLTKNVLYNLGGHFLPLFIAIIAIPVIITHIGSDRFGILTLAWSLIGYFSLFDLGLGRALTQAVAERIGANEVDEIPATIWTSLFLITVLGVLGSVLLAIIAPWLTYRALRVPLLLQSEALSTFYLLACAIPLVTLTSGLRGVLEAKQKFAAISLIRIFIGFFTYASALIASLFSNNLLIIVGLLIILRIITLIFHLRLCIAEIPQLKSGIELRSHIVRPMIRFGGWMTVSNVVGPLMVNLDRFLIAGTISVAAVAYYATPYEAITKLWVIPAGIVGVLFPAFATSHGQRSEKKAILFTQGVKYILIALFPVTLLFIFLSPEIMYMWLGSEFVLHSSRVLQWLAVGVFTNSLAQVPLALIQSIGRPDLTAKLHLIELPLYIGALFGLMHLYGIEGAAIAWTVRVVLDTFALFLIALNKVPGTEKAFKTLLLSVTFLLLILFLATIITHFITKLIFLTAIICIFGLCTWNLFLTEAELLSIKHYSRVLLPRSLRAKA
jgi:O-antigen/teichoic acid export membrane protein